MMAGLTKMIPARSSVGRVAWMTLVVVAAAPAAARVAPCPDARYLVDTVTPAPTAGNPGPEQLMVAGGDVLVDGCRLQRPRWLPARQGRKTHGRVEGCLPGDGRKRLRVVFDASCRRLEGVLASRRLRPRRLRFGAHRVECGDGRVQAGEECDLGVECGAGQRCSKHCVCEAAVVGGTTTTTVTTNTTLPPGSQCGNGLADLPEACDGADLSDQTCGSRGFPEGGCLGCNTACDGYDATGCFWCGDGTKEGPEECDGNDFGPAGKACTGPGEHGGTLVCTIGGAQSHQYPTGCKIDRQFCWVCGNGRIDSDEACDDGNATSGDSCSATCQGECGDGVVQYTEGCDDGNTTADDGCTECGSDLVYFGGNDEVDAGGKHYDQRMLRWGVEAPYSGGSQAAVTEHPSGLTVTCLDRAGSCDSDAPNNGQCTFLTFYCLNMAALTPGACFKSTIARIDVLPATTVGSAAQAAILGGFEDTFVRIGGVSPATIGQTATSLVLSSPNSLSSMCGAFRVVVETGPPTCWLSAPATTGIRFGRTTTRSPTSAGLDGTRTRRDAPSCLRCAGRGRGIGRRRTGIGRLWRHDARGEQSVVATRSVDQGTRRLRHRPAEEPPRPACPEAPRDRRSSADGAAGAGRRPTTRGTATRRPAALRRGAGRQAGEPWSGFADLGLAGIAVLAGDTGAARRHDARVVASGSASSAFAAMIVALIDAGDGRTGDATRALEAIASDPHTASSLREAALLGIGYALYWGEEYEAAAQAFARVERHARREGERRADQRAHPEDRASGAGSSPPAPSASLAARIVTR